jgi:hypothetical protein
MSGWLVLAHGSGDEGAIVLAPLIMVGGGLALVFLERRSRSRGLLFGALASVVLLLAAVIWMPRALHTCTDWRQQLLQATSALVSASGSGSQTPPGLTAQDHTEMQGRVREILRQRPFGCV